MREIKFRAWDKERKQMVGELQVWDWCENRIIAEDTGDELEPIENFELMQYTGLKDSYATEEYFGYIIEEDDGTRRVIEDGNSAVLFKNPKVKYDIKYFWELKPHKVIGNVYDNPELLETK